VKDAPSAGKVAIDPAGVAPIGLVLTELHDDVGDAKQGRGRVKRGVRQVPDLYDA
jgi:hypothetical protein